MQISFVLYIQYFQCLDNERKIQFCPGSNRGPFACEANVITTTLQNCVLLKIISEVQAHEIKNRFSSNYFCIAHYSLTVKRNLLQCMLIRAKENRNTETMTEQKKNCLHFGHHHFHNFKQKQSSIVQWLSRSLNTRKVPGSSPGGTRYFSLS